MSYSKVMVGSECYGAGTQKECEAIVNMHKNVKNGHKKETKASTLDFKIVTVEGEYPSKEAKEGTWKLPSLGYKPGRYPTSGELK